MKPNLVESTRTITFTELVETSISTASYLRIRQKSKSGASITIREAATGRSYILSFNQWSELLIGASGIYCTKDDKEASFIIELVEYTSMTWDSKLTPAEFGIESTYFSDYPGICYSDGNNWYTSDGTIITNGAPYSRKNRTTPRIIIIDLGDSMTSNKGVLTAPGNLAWTPYTSLLSGGKIGWVRGFATGGYTAKNAYELLLPSLLDRARITKPTHCTVLLGRNDTSTGSRSTLIQYLGLIYDALLENNIIPIGYAIPPTLPEDSTSLKTQIKEYNMAIKKLCLDKCVQFIDWTHLLIDPATGGWLSGYSISAGDIHPGEAANLIMGTYSSSQILARYPGTEPYDYAFDNVETNGVVNPLLIDVTGTLPTGWQWRYGGTAQCTIAMGAATVGNYLSMSPTSTSWEIRSAALACVPGDVIEVGFKINITGKTSGQFTVSVLNLVDLPGTTPPIGVVYGIKGNVTDYWYHERCIAGPNFSSARVTFNVVGANGTMKIEQFTFRNLTALGQI